MPFASAIFQLLNEFCLTEGNFLLEEKVNLGVVNLFVLFVEYYDIHILMKDVNNSLSYYFQQNGAIRRREEGN